jgi:Mrp family chromosome partitioning ATPase
VAVANPDEIEVTRPEEMRQRAGFERDESWTGPSRAHRRSASARRTTQVLGSPIAPVVQQGEPGASPHVSTPSAQPPPQRSSTSPTGYSYVSDRPEARPAATPPYYYPPAGTEARKTGANQTTPRPPTMSHSAPAPSQRSRVAAEPVRRGWSPDPSVDLTLRRQLSDQIVPLAVERCFVLGVVAVPDAQKHKARVTAELAMALAEPKRPRVLLMEADFARPAVHRILQLDMPTSRGLSQQLRTRGQNPNEAWTVLELSPTLHVIAEGIVRLPGLLLTAQFEDGLRSLRGHYDVIVLHGPDTSAEVDCRALGGLVDGVICVAPQAGSPDLASAGEAFPEVRFSAAVGV